MTVLSAIFRELMRLFVDDGSLALAVLATVALAAVVARLAPDLPLTTGLVLVGGCLGSLFVNVMRAAQ